ncbi:MAG TPA: hypothetical protein VKB39_01955 [Candidatus Baltobacteraceae bacterium]|nr:hypothetical protein [Candidatus Baltobacteraceae bacterium]
MSKLRSAAAIVAIWAALTGRAPAMPPFAQAYGAKCTLCHLQVPALNAFGRYVQRMGYSVLDHARLERSQPLWLGFNPSFDSQSDTSPHHLQFGNVAIHAVGMLSPNVTYHIQQWIRQDGQAGGLDTAWFAFNNLFDRNGHLFAGKIEAPAPSPYSQWFDLASFAAPEITVGEHAYQLDNNRWGMRLAYIHDSLDAEAGWLGSNGDLSGAGDFSNNTDKTLQWKLAYATPANPLEFGIFGSRGALHLTEGGTDQYHSIAGYVERDPTAKWPGFFASYQRAFDSNPGGGMPSASSSALTLEVYKTILHDNGIVGIRREFTNDGLGTLQQTGNVDFEYHIARFLHAYVETYTQQHAKLGYRYMLWWTVPFERSSAVTPP